ncbi:hypothetical protein [Spiroplasma endosymbiont of Nebria brevicollis]
MKGENAFKIYLESNIFRFNLDINGYDYETWSRNNISIIQGNDDSVWPA